MKILIFKVGAIGDILMATPFIRLLRKTFPQAEITAMTGEFARPALETNKNIDKLRTFDQNIIYKKKLFGILRLINRIKKENYDLVFSLDKSWQYGLLFRLTGIKQRIGFNRGNEGRFYTKKVGYWERKHEIEYYKELAYAVGAKKTNDNKLELDLSKEDIAFADKFWKDNKLKNDVVGIAPGGADNPGQSMPSRRWPAERFCETAKILGKKRQILWLGGPKDSINCNIGISSIGKTTIRQSTALMAKCKLVITNDSGPMHLAGSTNTKVLAVFGPTDPLRKSPPKSTSLWDEVECMRAEIYADYRGLERHILHIQVDDVVKTANNILKSR